MIRAALELKYPPSIPIYLDLLQRDNGTFRNNFICYRSASHIIVSCDSVLCVKAAAV